VDGPLLVLIVRVVFVGEALLGNVDAIWMLASLVDHVRNLDRALRVIHSFIEGLILLWERSLALELRVPHIVQSRRNCI